ncbi:MAG: response regulator [Treponema sp.]|nr:response regulator [Treponema sp.]MCL2250432.1 response regulator [Treponema sp.]
MNQDNKKFIVLVDDNPVTLQSGMNVLSGNYRVATAPSAIKLFELLEANQPDIIILDVDIPEVNGYQIIQVLKFRADTKDIPVIFLTGKTNSEDEVMGLSLGAIDYITKPFQPSLLLKRVEMHLLIEEQNKKIKNIVGLHDTLIKTMMELAVCQEKISEGSINEVQQQIRVLLDQIKINN